MAKKHKRSVSRRRPARSTRLPVLLAVLAVSTLVSAGVIMGSLYQGDVSVLGSHTKNAKNGSKNDKKGKNNNKNARDIALNLTVTTSIISNNKKKLNSQPSSREFTATVYTNNGKKLVKSAIPFTLTTGNPYAKSNKASGPKQYRGVVNLGSFATNNNYQVVITSPGFTSHTYRVSQTAMRRSKDGVVYIVVPPFTLSSGTNPSNNAKGGNKQGAGGGKNNNKRGGAGNIYVPPVEETYETTEFVDPPPVELQ